MYLTLRLALFCERKEDGENENAHVTDLFSSSYQRPRKFPRNYANGIRLRIYILL